jgi:hypothetical protein
MRDRRPVRGPAPASSDSLFGADPFRRRSASSSKKAPAPQASLPDASERDPQGAKTVRLPLFGSREGAPPTTEAQSKQEEMGAWLESALGSALPPNPPSSDQDAYADDGAYEGEVSFDAEDTSSVARQGKLPGLSSGKQWVSAARLDKRSEDSIQTESARALSHAGYEVFVNTVRMRQIRVVCHHCRAAWWQKPDYSTGQTPGIPDLDIFNPAWHHPLMPATPWLGLEQKSATGSLRSEQKALRDAGHIVVCRSSDDNLAAAAAMDGFFKRVGQLEKLLEVVVHEEALAPLRDHSALSSLLETLHPLSDILAQKKAEAESAAKAKAASRKRAPKAKKAMPGAEM